MKIRYLLPDKESQIKQLNNSLMTIDRLIIDHYSEQNQQHNKCVTQNDLNLYERLLLIVKGSM